jgi:hypothetical protein
MFTGSGNPDGLYRAAKGSLWQDRVNGVLFQNQDGVTRWLPFSTVRLACWLDAAQESYTNGATVSLATDFSSRGGNHATSPSGWRPTFVTAATPAGGPAFQFSCTNNGNFSGDLDTDPGSGDPQFMRTPLIANPCDGMTVFIVARRNGTAVEHTVFYRGASAEGSGAWLKETWGSDTPTNAIDKLKWDQPAEVISDSDSTSWFIHCVRFESSSLARHWYNGVEYQNWDPGSDFDRDNAFIIAGGGNLQIAEFKAYVGAMGNGRVDAQFESLADKHGITL